MIQFFIYASTFAHMCIAAMPDAETAAAIVTLLFSLSLSFNGVFQAPSALPGFWIFMYRVSPFTYWIAAMAGTQVNGKPVACSSTELSVFPPPAGQSCGQYLAAFLTDAPGQLLNPTSTTSCQYCGLRTADQLVAGSNIYYSQRWRNFGVFWAYIIFNIAMAVLLYYVFRVLDVKKISFRSKKGAKAKEAAETVAEGVGGAKPQTATGGAAAAEKAEGNERIY